MSLKPKVVEFDTEWSKIRRVLDQVLSGEKVNKADWMDRFLDVYNLTIAKPTNLGEKLYFHVSDYFKAHVACALEETSQTPPSNFLTTYHKSWMLYKKGVATLNQLFSYLNTHFVRSSHMQEVGSNFFAVEDFMQIEEMGLHIWKQGMVLKHSQQLIDLVVLQIDEDRKMGSELKPSTVRDVVMSFVDVEKYGEKVLEFYQETIEQAILKKTEEYYRLQAQSLSQSLMPFEYVTKVLQILDEENLRSQKYLDSSSSSKVVRVLREVLVSEHLDYINRDIHATIRDVQKENLSSLYKLLHTIPYGLKALKEELEKHFYTRSRRVIEGIDKDTVNPSQEFVLGTSKIHMEGRELVKEVFKGDLAFHAVLDKALNQSINDKIERKSCQLKPAEMLVKHCDALLRRNTKGDGGVEEQLMEAVSIFNFLDDKDFFNKYYSSLMAKRFICSTTTSMEAEEFMINKLKEISGYEYTSKLHRMFTDVGISSDLSNKFAEYVQELPKNEQPTVTASVMVLQMGAWPVEPLKSFTFNLPREFERNLCLFEEFYNKRFNGRKLTWLPYLCQWELKLCYTKRPYFASMATPFYIILSTFDNSTHSDSASSSSHDPAYSPFLPFEAFLENSAMSEQALIKYLQILISNKFILHQQGDSPISTSSHFSINNDFSSKKSKIKLNIFHKEAAAQDLEKVKTRLENDRLMFLEAVIVRVMKARKVLAHNALVQEVIEQSKVRFTPPIPLIKRSISSLLERSFIERTEEDKNVYKYVA